ncbi:MAG: ParA family protein [Chlamydiales bacterium]|nr:ParA family protein [Chlamydiales bacterium]
MDVVTFCSFKGGTAKTSSTLHLGACLAKFFHKKILLIDFDAQANLSAGLGLGVDQEETIGLVLQGKRKIQDVIRKTSIELLDIAPANVYLDGIESTTEIVTDLYGHERLRKALKGLDYDYILIDTPPSLGWLTQSALFAANYSVICAIPEPYSILALNRLKEYHDHIKENHLLTLLGVILTFWDERGSTNQAYLQAIEHSFPDKVFQTKIRRDIRVSRSILEGKPIMDIHPTARASEDYYALSQEFLHRLMVQEGSFV